MIWFGAYVRSLSLFSLFAIAALRAGMPSTAVYFVKPSFIAAIAASLITRGVSKSGSPAEKLMMSLPCAFHSPASVEIAMVMDSESEFIRSVSIFSPF